MCNIGCNENPVGLGSSISKENGISLLVPMSAERRKSITAVQTAEVPIKPSHGKKLQVSPCDFLYLGIVANSNKNMFDAANMHLQAEGGSKDIEPFGQEHHRRRLLLYQELVARPDTDLVRQAMLQANEI